LSGSRPNFYEVRLSSRTIGHLVQVQDYTNFVWSPAYWEALDRPILGLYFEDAKDSRYAASLRLPPWFSNLLPEGRLRDWIAADRGVSPQREMELLAQVGHDLPGAVSISQATDEPQFSPEFPTESAGSDVGPKDAAHENRIKFSLSGVQLKYSMLRTGDRLTLPASGKGDWIVKLPDATFPHVPLNEFVMMSMARDCGIQVPDVELYPREALPPLPDVAWPNGEGVAFAIRRFDRDEFRQAVHIEDFAQVRNKYPQDKYSSSLATVAALCYRGRDVQSLREWCRRTVFNVLIGNGDAHLKNWSLLYLHPRRPKLSPAYDIVSTFWYSALAGGEEDLGLTWGGKKLFDRVTLAGFAALDERLDAKADLADVARETALRFDEVWSARCHDLAAVSGLMRELTEWSAFRRRQFA
jgi:serine/threonine-protein kinase HipA